MKKIDKDNNIDSLEKQCEDDWKDWFSNTYDYTIESIENLDVEIIYEYINKIRSNIKNNTSIYSDEYLNECLMYIELILKGYYEYIDLLENLEAYYPHREEFIDCLKRISEIKY